jgi:hypothetical protein
MCGPETLEVKQITDLANPRRGKIPIPPIMDTQLDQIVIRQVLHPLRKRLLDLFESKISPPKPEDWFDIYLTAFVVLSHIERLARHSTQHATLHSMPVGNQLLCFSDMDSHCTFRPNFRIPGSWLTHSTRPRSSCPASTLFAMGLHP